jgi:hypothetical protein
MIVATGNYRTGSTLVFNLAREMCFEYGKDFEVIQFGYSTEEIADLVRHGGEDRKLFVLKSHEYVPEKDFPKLKCLHTTRNFLDAFASSVVLKGTELNDETLSSLKHQKDRDRKMAGLSIGYKFQCVKIFKYEDFYSNTDRLIDDIAEYLGFKVTKWFKGHLLDEYNVNRVREEYQDFREEHDLVKWFRPNHVSYYNGQPGYYKNILTGEQIAKIEAIL